MPLGFEPMTMALTDTWRRWPFRAALKLARYPCEPVLKLTGFSGSVIRVSPVSETILMVGFNVPSYGQIWRLEAPYWARTPSYPVRLWSRLSMGIGEASPRWLSLGHPIAIR